MGDPAGQPAESEQDGEHVHGEAHRLVDQARVEVHVWVQLAFLEVRIAERGIFEANGDVKEFVPATEGLQDLVRMLLHDGGARIVVLVDPVAEAHQLGGVLLVLDLVDVARDVPALVADLGEHLEDGLVRAAVERSRQGADPGRDGDVDVGARRPHQADGGRRAVLFVVGVQDQEHVQGAGDRVVERVRRGRESKRHAQEVLDVALGFVRVQERLTHRGLVAVGGQGRHLAEQPEGGVIQVARLDPESRGGEGGQRIDTGGQHRHRVRTPGEEAEHLLESLIQQL